MTIGEQTTSSNGQSTRVIEPEPDGLEAVGEVATAADGDATRIVTRERPRGYMHEGYFYTP